MKQRILHITFFALALASCDAFLDEVPDNRVSLDNLDKAAQLLTNGYPIASVTFTDWMSDDVQFTRGTNIRPSHFQLYNWEDVTSGPDEQDTPDFFWYETYNAIAHANEVLAVLDELPVVTEEDEAHKDAVEAEAKLIRAYGHFMLVNVFSKQYSQESDDDLGVPYVKTPETEFIVEYERLSVEDVYEEIEDDLLDGLELVSDNFYSNSGKYHFNQNAALAFASRFYLYTGDFVKCRTYANQLFGSNPGAFVRDMTSDTYQNAKSSITGYPQLYSSPDEPANLMLMRKISLMQRTDFAYGPTRTFYGDLFASNPYPGTSDERENPAFVKGENALLPVRYESLFQRNSLNSNVGLPYHIELSFRGEEVLFNRMEANLYLGNLDEVLEDFQVLAERRYSGGTVITTMEGLRDFLGVANDPSFSDELTLLNMILLEKRKEFIIQGHRWFDLKRYGLDIEHDLEDGTIITLPVDDDRWVMQIPQSAIQVGGLEPNPR